MPAWVVVALAAGAVSLTGMAVGLFHLKRWLKGSGTVALVGRSGTGKSTFLHVVQNGTIPPRGLPPTTAQISEQHVRVGNREFTVIDNAGDRLRDWFNAFDSSPHGIYFFDASRVGRGDPETLSALREDADHLRLMRHPKRKRNFLVVGTHTDLLKNIEEHEVRSHPEIDNLLEAVGAGSDDLLMGSMGATMVARKLVADVARAANGSSQ